ncbi:MAG: Maf family protein [Acidobacteriota bacterium]|jgi:septum formation protein
MLILASASPRRRSLLAQAGVRCEVIPAEIDETQRPGETPIAYVERLALEKARAIHALHPEAAVLGADTTVAMSAPPGSHGEEIILSKPADLAEAERMLLALSDRVHEVHTGIALALPGPAAAQRTHVETTRVFFGPIPAEELACYLSTGDSLDKAGAYGIQGYAARWITRIEGDFFNVMGLPLAATVRLLRQTHSL